MDFLEKNLLGVIVLILILLALVIIGAIRSSQFRKSYRKHRSLGDLLDLSLAFTHADNYKIYGTYRGYQTHIQSLALTKLGQKEVEWATKISIPMINPNRRAIRILRPSQQYPQLSTAGEIARPLTVNHQISEWIDIQTNDMMFSHLILTDEVKMDLVVVFKKISSGMIFLLEEELVFLLPGLLGEAGDNALYKEALDTLCNIKDSLQ